MECLCHKGKERFIENWKPTPVLEPKETQRTTDLELVQV
jgi:hypothetical protein